MFDPFNDFATQGYLRNVRKDKDARNIKRFEHDLFEANIEAAFAHLASHDELTYQDFLAVHRILFADYYPWAGQDRLMTLPNSAVKKGDVLFSHPQSSRLAVEHGLSLGQDTAMMAKKPGEVMGLFAYGHPFLDGNGRTMLPVHIELCHRAGFSIAWHKTNKLEYLSALSKEIERPGQGILDAYLLQFKGPVLERSAWGADILGMKGLDGLEDVNQIDGDLSDPAVAEKYRKLEERRGYSYAATPNLAQMSELPFDQNVGQ
jgi:cell filamentation protein